MRTNDETINSPKTHSGNKSGCSNKTLLSFFAIISLKLYSVASERLSEIKDWPSANRKIVRKFFSISPWRLKHETNLVDWKQQKYRIIFHWHEPSFLSIYFRQHLWYRNLGKFKLRSISSNICDLRVYFLGSYRLEKDKKSSVNLID